MVPCPSTLDVSHELVEHVSWLIHARRREIGTRWRRLGCYEQALLVLAHLRKNETFAQVAGGFGVSETTAWPYVDKTLEILSAWAPGLREALVGLGEGEVKTSPSAARQASNNRPPEPDRGGGLLRRIQNYLRPASAPSPPSLGAEAW